MTQDIQSALNHLAFMAGRGVTGAEHEREKTQEAISTIETYVRDNCVPELPDGYYYDSITNEGEEPGWGCVIRNKNWNADDDSICVDALTITAACNAAIEKIKEGKNGEN